LGLDATVCPLADQQSSVDKWLNLSERHRERRKGKFGKKMVYKRFENEKTLSKQEKVELLEEYVNYYKELFAEKGLDALNVKIPRNVFESILDKIGEILVTESIKSSKEGSVKEFLDMNPVPPHMKELLPDEFRAFSLMLNALKQWVSAESAATDRFLLGGTARKTCRSAINKCIITNEVISNDGELHHPLRDGRPPILLSKNGHTKVEQNNQKIVKDDDNNEKSDIWEKIKVLRAEKHMSWVQLREGCTAIITGSNNYRSGAKSFANKIIKETGLDAGQIVDLLDLKNV
jgi:hypothetical protein